MADPSMLCECEHVRRVGLWRRLCLACRAAKALVPTACVLCQGNAKGGQLCQYCYAAVVASMNGGRPRCHQCCLVLDLQGQCPDCALREPAFARVIAAFDYAPPADLLIHYLKRARRFTSAGMLADLLADAVRQAQPALPHNMVLVPVPSSRASLLERGFNPAAEIARGLGKALHLGCKPGWLQRAQEGSRQTRLKRSERMHSALSLYRCPVRVEGAVIAVVDDVMTTGSTLHSIALEFKAAGAQQVYGLVLARTPVGRTSAPGA